MKIMKKVKKTILIVSVLFISLSATVFATEAKTGISENNAIELIDLQEDGDYRIEFSDSDYETVYSGNEIKPEFQVVLVTTVTNPEGGIVLEDKTVLPEECYEIEYLNNTNAGIATVKVTGKEEAGYCNTISADYVISPKSVENAKLELSSTKYLYDGKEKNPKVTVTLDHVVLENAVDYDVVYSNNSEVGTAYAKIVGKGNYTGSLKAQYSIVLNKSTVSSLTNYNKVKISWTKVTGASGYELLRSTSKNSGYKVIKNITSGSTCSYTDTDVKFNKTYYYKVRAYRTVGSKKVYSELSAIKTVKIKPGTPAISTVSKNSATSLKVTWNKISGASGYAIYRSTSENGKYTRIATVKNNTFSYTDKGQTCGRTYYYKIRAYRTVNRKNYYSLYSSVKSGNTTPGKVSWNTTKMLYDATSITLNWKKVSEATGYEIYRADEKNGTYTKVKTITKNSTLSWENTGLTKGVKYYYKIRSYKKVDGKTVYGSYSSVYEKSVAGWKYSTYDGQKVKLYYNSKGDLVKDVSNLIGKQSSYVIKVNKRANTVTVYAKDGSNGYIIPVKSFICSTGAATPLGTFKTPQKLRWHELDGPSYGQWCTRITGHILFHSVWYYKPSNTTLSVAQYNKLGTQASHGCVRLTARDAKWIYDNCKLNTKVIIYNSSSSGPLGKPTAYKLPSWHTWDPTDPNVKSKCAAKGCH